VNTAAFGPAYQIVATVTVPRIPDGLDFDDRHSNHASSMFADVTVNDWFRGIVHPELFNFDHPLDTILNPSRNFADYIYGIEREGFKVWDTQNGDANVRLTLVSSDPTQEGRKVVISGRPDYLICKKDSDKNDFLLKTLCIIEIQPKKDEALCELQLLANLYRFMNRQGLPKVIGFLILNDGRVKAYRASRQPDIILEEDDYFQISHIAEVFMQLNVIQQMLMSNILLAK